MTGLLNGTVVLATGGGSGIGLAAVDAFIASGAQVGVLERSPAKADELKAKHGSKVVVVTGDATSLEDNERAVAETVKAFGKVDVLACFVGVFDVCAGLVDIPRERLHAAFDEIFHVNVKSYLLSTRAALDQLVKNEGRIIFTLSGSSFMAGGGGVLYVASKYALRGLVMELAHELSPKVRVNGVAPGGMRTDLRGVPAMAQEEVRSTAYLPEVMPTPLPYDPSPETIAPVYVQLASKEFTRAMTGEIIRPDGGAAVRGIVRAAGNAESMFWKF